MNTATLWFLIIGLLLLSMAMAEAAFRTLPISTSMVYLGLGVFLGPVGMGMIDLRPLDNPGFVEVVAEIAVLISLFAAGLKLRIPWKSSLWRIAVRLAVPTMIISVALISMGAYLLLDLSVGAAVLLAAIIAPTDPVLASEVQSAHPGDRDRVRFSLTAEGGLNDGMAFPFVMLGLGLLGAHDLGSHLSRWIAVDVVFAVFVGLLVGWLLGQAVGRLMLFIRRRHQETTGIDEFLAMGLVAIAYGTALAVHSYGFLAVFAAGLALRNIESSSSGGDQPKSIQELNTLPEEDLATDAAVAPAYLAHSLSRVNLQLERLAEVAIVVLIGAMVPWSDISWPIALFITGVFVLIRPLAVQVCLTNTGLSSFQRGMISWFGIRGVGSLYYLMYSLTHGLVNEESRVIFSVVMMTMVASIVIHGISATPLMSLYSKRSRKR